MKPLFRKSLSEQVHSGAKRRLKDAAEVIADLQMRNEALLEALAILREGIRIGAIPNMIIVPEGASKEIRLLEHIDSVMRHGRVRK
jgi:hypothetical protein